MEKLKAEDLSEILEIFVENGLLEKIGTHRYSSSKRKTEKAVPSKTILGHKAYYLHPHCEDSHRSSLPLAIATKAAAGTLGTSPIQKFLPPDPEEMLDYQKRCLENFMKRYTLFYETVTRSTS